MIYKTGDIIAILARNFWSDEWITDWNKEWNLEGTNTWYYGTHLGSVRSDLKANQIDASDFERITREEAYSSLAKGAAD